MPATLRTMRNNKRLQRLEQLESAAGNPSIKLYFTSDDWMQHQPPIYLDATDSTAGTLSIYTSCDPCTLPAEVATHLVTHEQIAQDEAAGVQVIILRHTSWPPKRA